jgi:hypothetical protein
MTARWEDTLDTMLRLRWEIGGHIGLQVLSVCGLARPLPKPDEYDAEYDKYMQELSQSLAKGAAIALDQAAPIYVAPDVASVWSASHVEFPAEVLLESDLLIPHGFALLPEPVTLPRPHADALTPPVAQALLWMTVSPAAAEVDGEEVGGVHTWVLCQERDLAFDYGLKKRGWACVWADLIRWDHTPIGPDRSFQAFWRLMRQFVPQRERLPRAAARRAAHARVPDDRMPTVMRLRRKAPARSDPQGGTVEYSCQWPVRPHWRNQWYPSLGEHRAKLIPGYVKGPADKPLRHAERVIEFIR